MAVMTWSLFTGAQKLGHPDPASYFVAASYNGSPQPTHKYVPGAVLETCSPLNGCSASF